MRPAKRKTTSEREKPEKRGEDAIKGVTKPTTKGGKGDDGVQAGRDKGVQANHTHFFFSPKQVYLWGSILEKNRLDALVGALGLVGRGFGCAGRAAWGWAWCWARWAGLGVDLAVLGALRGVGRGVGRAGLGWAWIWLCWARCVVGRGVGRAGLGWAWIWLCWARCVGLGVVLGALGWVGRGVWPCWARWRGVGRGVWPCWARWAGLGVGFGRAGRAGLGWAWGLAVLGALGWVRRGVWPCWARWRGCWAWSLAVLGALGWAWGLAVLGAVGWVGRGRGRAGRGGLGWALGAVGWVGRGLWPCCGLGVGVGVAWAKNLAKLCEDLWVF